MEGVEIDKKTLSNLRVLINLGQSLGKLVYLRYISVRNTEMLIFPASIQNLKLLQTLNFKTKGVLYFPPWMSTNIVTKLRQLRHLHLSDWTCVKYYRKAKLRFDELSKLETLENFNPSWCEVRDLPKLTNLRKLTLHVIDSYDNVEEMMKYLPYISTSYLRYLSLEIFWCSLHLGNVLKLFLSDHCSLHRLLTKGFLPEIQPLFHHQQQQLCEKRNSTNLSSSITTLILLMSFFKEDPMLVLERFSKLHKLELKSESFVGREMVCSAMGFPQLRSLTLYDLPNLEKWKVEKGGMPNLSYLYINDCPKLEELPEGLKFLDSLRELELKSMPTSFCNRLQVLNGEQGADFYKVVHVSTLNFK